MQLELSKALLARSLLKASPFQKMRDMLHFMFCQRRTILAEADQCNTQYGLA